MCGIAGTISGVSAALMLPLLVGLCAEYAASWFADGTVWSTDNIAKYAVLATLGISVVVAFVNACVVSRH